MINWLKKIIDKMADININGTSFQSSQIIINNDQRIIINGKDVTPDAKKIDIKIDGNVDLVQVSACNSITVNGDTNSVKTSNGDVEVKGDVKEWVKTTNGDVKCGNVGGDVKTVNGDIKRRK